MAKIEVVFYGIDSWNRPIFKDIGGKAFYGSTDKLFDDTDMESAEKEVTAEDLLYFGDHFGCEPMGLTIPDIVIIKENEPEPLKMMDNFIKGTLERPSSHSTQFTLGQFISYAAAAGFIMDADFKDIGEGAGFNMDNSPVHAAGKRDIIFTKKGA